MLISCIAATLAMLSAAAASGDSWRAAAESALSAALREAYPDASDWHIVPLIGSRQEKKLQTAGDVSTVVARLGTRSSVRITWKRGEHPVGATVWFAVEGTQRVLSTRSKIPARVTLTPADLDYVSQDILALTCTPLSSSDDLAGMRAKRTLRAGEAICVELIEPRPAVARGEGVVVRSVAGAVTITAKAMAQQDGALGQRVRVKNPSSGEIYLASVSGVGEVVVNE